ncbi:L,D-transpeptidase family protein [Microbulbifer pacificus]|uniref:L,D-transpeptidase family protein n=1 Tax=Microbulbifer pacificus TaxID=407164 RepID=A0AAU0N5A4_9GAMM|nr:L,D-transpeptidase family protein [Microbulbifer pacificus]WOX07103.1 L,D-transpeptidase family protein [Microbulbifer pacificus]
MRTLKFCLFSLLLLPTLAFAKINPVDEVVVYKAKHLMQLKRNGKVVKSYKVVFGKNPVGHKQYAGDSRTPEGRYTLNWKKKNSTFYRAIHVSYPNAADRARAAKLGKSPGGAIMIHGQKPHWKGIEKYLTRMNWTDGCIAVTNPEMDEIWAMVNPGTPIEIFP